MRRTGPAETVPADPLEWLSGPLPDTYIGLLPCRTGHRQPNFMPLIPRLIAIGAFFVLSGVGPAQQADDLMVRAREAVRQGDNEGAVALTTETLAESPDDASALLLRALANYRLNRMGEAEADLSAAMAASTEARGGGSVEFAWPQDFLQWVSTVRAAYAPSADLPDISLDALNEATPTRTVTAHFVMDVELVRIPVIVEDERGFMSGLGAESFRVVDGTGEPQPIRELIPEDEPTSIGILVDAGDGMQEFEGAAREAVAKILEALLPEDEIFIAQFGADAHFLSDFTTDRVSLAASMAGYAPGTGRAVHDAIAMGLIRMRSATYEKKALIVLSRGDDEGSETSDQDVLLAARREGVAVHALLVMPEAPALAPDERGNGGSWRHRGRTGSRHGCTSVAPGQRGPAAGDRPQHRRTGGGAAAGREPVRRLCRVAGAGLHRSERLHQQPVPGAVPLDAAAGTRPVARVARARRAQTRARPRPQRVRAMRPEHQAEVAAERESGDQRTASALFLDMEFAPRLERQRVKWAWAFAIVFHFLLFAVVMPTPGTADFTADKAEIMVIRRYEPPEVEKREKPRRRRKAPAVPIPDPTPDGFEPLMPEDDEDAPPEDVDVVYEFGPPMQVGPPVQAIAIETEGLVLPMLLQQVEPDYEADLARRGVQGAADVEIVINTEGLVSVARIINSTRDEGLDQAALDAVKQWLFEPGMLAGELVPVRAVVTINFRVY